MFVAEFLPHPFTLKYFQMYFCSYYIAIQLRVKAGLAS